ncbi:hypothetical protein V6N13_126545 [Hibiscus sabdariffa]
MVFLQEKKLDSFNLKEARKLWGGDEFELVVSPVIGPSRCLVSIWDTNLYTLCNSTTHQRYIGITGKWGSINLETDMINFHAPNGESDQAVALWEDLLARKNQSSSVNADGTYGNSHGIKNLESHASNKEFLTQLFPPSYGRKSDIDVFGSEFLELMAIHIGINLVLEANWVGQQALEAVSLQEWPLIGSWKRTIDLANGGKFSMNRTIFKAWW